MTAKKNVISIIDLFAGPGGLGEGFSALGEREGMSFFKVLLAIEKEKAAYGTLRLRRFFRQFPLGEAPEEYYDLLRGKLLSEEELYSKFPHQAEKSLQEARLFELGA
jgi:DNA (cytosine-5)-methyltransferase 1